MDRVQEASNVIVKINKHRRDPTKAYELIETVCGYFDKIKDNEITQSDLKFLKYISNLAGIPHYYDLLNDFQEKTDIHDFDLKTFSSILYESTLHTSKDIKLHKYQREILDRFTTGKLNRFVLSASTSFGKTFLVYEIIKKMNYKNILLIFPTIALLSENHELLITDRFQYFNKFKIHTLSEVKFGENNLFIYTPERFLSFIEKNSHNPHNLDFAFVDEVYKIDNDYVIDDSVKENERDVAYRIALYHILLSNIDVLLSGPYIEFRSSREDSYNPSFDNFMKKNYFKLIDYNDYEIVNKTIDEIKTARKIELDERLTINFDSNGKVDRLITIIKEINKIGENCIVYCSTKPRVERYANKIVASKILENTDLSSKNLIKHLENNFKREWIVVKALKHRIGIHHGSVPKYIQKEIINLFNDGHLKVLISTTTITEGVNTAAKNMIVLHDRKGIKPLKKFDAKNISGRAGRFQQHYSGRVIVLQNDFKKIIESEAEGIKHKNYDITSPKDEIDLFFTKEDYLNGSDQEKKRSIKAEQSQRNIPDNIISLYKVVSRMDKISIYDSIVRMNEPENTSIRNLISKINSPSKLNIKYDGFQVILDIISPIVKDKKLRDVIKYKSVSRLDGKEYSVLTHLVYAYLKYGFVGSVDYKIDIQKKKIDVAIRETSDFIYNTLKYHLVKYLGVFNIMYKFRRSLSTNTNYDQISGIDKLLTKLEYNAVSEEGRLASDYGVPYKIVEYYDVPENRAQIQFDEYENQVFEKVKKIIKNE